MSRQATSTQENGWLVVLGSRGGKCVKTQKSGVFMPGSRFGPRFPIIVKVATEEEADEVLTFSSAIQVIMKADTLEQQIRLATELTGWNTILSHYNGFYCVVYGNQAAIYVEYQDALNSVSGISKPIWKTVGPFGRALAYMISKSESERVTNADLNEIVLSACKRDANDEVNPIVEALPDLSLSARNSGGDRSTNAAPGSGGTKMRPETVHSQPEVREYVYETTSPSPSPAPGSQPPPYAAVFDDPVFSQFVFETPNRVPDIGPSYVYQHVRTLRGIKSTHTAPVGDRTDVPSCGPAVDAFLQAFGFDTESCLSIARSIHDASGMADFVRDMCEYGLPALEVKYIWYLYSSSPPRAIWAETHIM